MSIFGAGHEVVTSLTRPATPLVGQTIYQTDTDEFLKYVSYSTLNLDGGAPNSVYGGVNPINAGGV